MERKNWTALKRISSSYTILPQSDTSKHQGCGRTANFVQLAFDFDSERLVATDTKGILYCIDLSNDSPCYCIIGNVGLCTAIAFNPIDKTEVLIGLTSAEIKVIKINDNITQLCLLVGHKVPPTLFSFYKQYGLTCSSKEVIIWNLVSFDKAHQLQLNIKNVVIRKASFSNLGNIVALYHNDTMQAWMFNQLANDKKIDIKTFGANNIKDYVFTINGNAIILASGKDKIVILSTYDWKMIKCLTFPETVIRVQQLAVVPLPLDGGSNNVVAIVSSHFQLYFFDIAESCFLKTLEPINGIRKAVVSWNGRYLAYIAIQGHLIINICEQLLERRNVPCKKVKVPCKLGIHKLNDHLKYIRQEMKEELRLERLLPILKEFGEYPEKYRAIIWATILKLPVNKNAYVGLSNKECHKTADLLKNYTLADKSKSALLTTIIQSLIEWCPLLIQCTYLPKLVFPFVIVFQKNPLLAFEATLSILFNYCQKWFEYHPLPPLNVLGIIENILLEADPLLLNIFCEHRITSMEYAWPLLQTVMSEVLYAEQWLILWDYLISYQRPSLLLMCIVAYTICSREVIISMLHSRQDIKQFYSVQNHIRAKDIFKLAQHLDRQIPYRLHPERYIRNQYVHLPTQGPYPPFILHEYPKFLPEDLSMLDTYPIEEEQDILQAENQHAMELAEQKKLHHAREAFLERIHRVRLDEARKCVKTRTEHMQRKQEGSIVQKQCVRAGPSTSKQNDQLLETKSYTDNSYCYTPIPTNEKTKVCQRLQKDVYQLEREIENFLNVTCSEKSGSMR